MFLPVLPLRPARMGPALLPSGQFPEKIVNTNPTHSRGRLIRPAGRSAARRGYQACPLPLHAHQDHSLIKPSIVATRGCRAEPRWFDDTVKDKLSTLTKIQQAHRDAPSLSSSARKMKKGTERKVAIRTTCDVVLETVMSSSGRGAWHPPTLFWVPQQVLHEALTPAPRRSCLRDFTWIRGR